MSKYTVNGEGWVVWTAGNNKPEMTESCKFDFVHVTGQIQTECDNDDLACWDKNSAIIAYRLTTNDHYINGERVVLQEGDYIDVMGLSSEEIKKVANADSWNTNYNILSIGRAKEGVGRQLTVNQVLNAEGVKPSEEEIREKLFQAGGELGEDLRGRDTTVSEQCEDLIENDSPDEMGWKKGTLPPTGIDCEVYTSGVWKAGFTVGKNKEGNVVVQVGENYIAKGSANSFRPLQTEREKVIETILSNVNNNIISSEKGTLERLYDLGMLKLPEGE